MISADHSGTMCNMEGIATKDQAIEFAKSVKNIFEESEGECNADDFINGRMNYMECTIEGESSNHFEINERQNDGKAMYRLKAGYEAEDIDTKELKTDSMASISFCTDEGVLIRVGEKIINLDDIYKKFK